LFVFILYGTMYLSNKRQSQSKPHIKDIKGLDSCIRPEAVLPEVLCVMTCSFTLWGGWTSNELKLFSCVLESWPSFTVAWKTRLLEDFSAISLKLTGLMIWNYLLIGDRMYS